MALAPTSSLLIPFSPSSTSPFQTYAISFPKLPLCPPRSFRSLIASASSYNPPPSEQAILEAIADSDATQISLPVVRTFENDLARLTLVGAVDFQQALTAAAADGGEAADEHLSSGLAAMVVETIFPGPSNDHSTVSTRLFLPARKVKEKATKLKKSLTKEMLHGAMSKNILAMTFRQVVIQQLWSLELALFRPGTERDMDNFENPRDVPVSLTLHSSDERVISEIGDVVCRAVLETTERHFLHDSTNRESIMFISWFNKHKPISSRNSSVVLYNLLEHEILANSSILLKKFNMGRGVHKLKGTNLKNSWWPSPAFSKLEKIGGPEFCAWISECVPSYMLEIDANKLSDMKFEGWRKSEANRWEVVLTHSQMVSLADILDMFYEDVFTLPNKRLSCYAVAKSSNLAINKGSSLLKILSIILVSGVFLVTVTVLRKLYLPHLPIRKNYIRENSQIPLSDVRFAPRHSVEIPELETCSLSIIRRIKNSFGWPGEIRINSNACAWTGELPKFLRKVDDTDSNMFDILSPSIPPGASNEETTALEDIASYQVVLSTDGNIIGFQPTNRIAVNNWAANPLAKELYGGKNLSPGLVEPGLKISHPIGVVVLELLMSLNPSSNFALVRPVDISGQLN
ncbi:uncharacterized protein LOC105175586 isoform X2 [Sesamum indicum]|uniref:Uncharacterized protein LOC105175586 isoform X2 n=1 Tax=Sesamum indicum TaxID=4182 RepID=A0A6I9UEK6_SESIN|nr:uncharacterized protein LOC105175586 isoform X2 [Sesamum indicum]